MIIIMTDKALSLAIEQLACSIAKLAEELRNQNTQQAVLNRIAQLETKIMSAISDFAAKQNEFNNRQDAAIQGLTDDIKVLNDKITELQNTAGQITPEDQALLDAIQARAEAATAKLEALDALTPPKPPVA